MKTDLYDNKAKKIGTVELPERLFSISWNSNLVHQALVTQAANNRSNIAHAKDRGEKRGGGRKPWQQKGLGRARHGSIRSPIWRGGGVAHGPLNRKSFGLKINKKMKQKAIFSAFSRRVKDGEVKVVKSLEVKDSKTKNLANTIDNFSDKRPSSLIIPSIENKDIYKASRNIENVKSLDPRSLNVYDVLRYKNILIEENAIDQINNHYHAIK